jgi:hypothetical protein
MIIKILPNNTVCIKDEGLSVNINSTHADKAPNALARSIAESLPYKPDVMFGKEAPTMTFNTEGQISVEGEPVDINDYSHLTGDAKAFVDALASNPNVVKLINAKNTLKELQDG